MNDDNLREALLLGAKEGHFLRAIQEHLNVDREKLVSPDEFEEAAKRSKTGVH